MKLAEVKNWWGRESHPTDEYIHWSEHARDELADKLRPAYDKIKAAGLEKELKALLSAAYTSGSDSEHDSHDLDI
jgi:hypothetical protein